MLIIYVLLTPKHSSQVRCLYKNNFCGCISSSSSEITFIDIFSESHLCVHCSAFHIPTYHSNDGFYFKHQERRCIGQFLHRQLRSSSVSIFFNNSGLLRSSFCSICCIEIETLQCISVALIILKEFLYCPKWKPEKEGI